MIKTKKEIFLIQKACKITDEIFYEIVSKLKSKDVKNKFKTELELSNFIENEAKKRGCLLSFDTIVASGKNAVEPHHKPTDEKLKGFIVIDFGVIYKKYMSDMTRTIYIGTPTKKEKSLYDLVLKSQLIGIDAARPNTKCSDVDLKARESLGNYKKYFIHGLGHGVGTRIHEKPRVNRKSRFYIKEDMVITIEPGIYIKRKKRKSKNEYVNILGIRIEDTCKISKGKCIPLTKSTKKLLNFNL